MHVQVQVELEVPLQGGQVAEARLVPAVGEVAHQLPHLSTPQKKSWERRTVSIDHFRTAPAGLGTNCLGFSGNSVVPGAQVASFSQQQHLMHSKATPQMGGSRNMLAKQC